MLLTSSSNTLLLTMSSSEEEGNDDDSQAGELQLWLQDDSQVKPAERTQMMITLAHCYIEDFSTDILPFTHKVF